MHSLDLMIYNSSLIYLFSFFIIYIYIPGSNGTFTVNRMDEKCINVRLYHQGEFKKTVYAGGKSLVVTRVQVDRFSYTVLMEFVKDYLDYTEIGGIYISKGRGGGWELMTKDAEVVGLTKDCVEGEEINFYIDNIVDKEIEPMIQMQPHVIIWPRKHLIQGIIYA